MTVSMVKVRRLILVAVSVACAHDQAGAAALRLEVDAPASLAAARARIEDFDTSQLLGIVDFVGLTEPGPAIRVVLAEEESDWAGEVPPWTAGLAFGAAGVVVLFPTRAPVYPNGTLEDVLRHEVAHVLIARAARNRPVPRWFHEGLAMAVERPSGFEDSARLVYELTLSSRLSLGQIDDLFAGERRAQTRAYALAGAFTREVLERHEASAPREILARVARDVGFENAFAEVTGVTLAEATVEFWRRQRLWTTWVPFATSTSALWMAVTLLALFAIRRRRQRSEDLHRRWADEDRLDSDSDQIR